MKYLKTFLESQRGGYEFKNENTFKTPYIVGKINIPKKDTQYRLPFKVNCGYRANNCDELHSFQDTSSRNIGNMNLIIKEWLEYFYDLGINPEVSQVEVRVSDLNVEWEVTIDRSRDGKPWIGFTSRGAGCGGDIVKRSEENFTIGKQNIKNKFPSSQFETIEVFEHKSDDNSFRQIFFKYTIPDKYPVQASENQIIVESDDIGELYQKIKEQTQGKSVDLNSVELNLDTKPYTLKINTGQEKIDKLIMAINTIDDRGNFPSRDKILQKNPKSELVNQGKFSSNKRDWAVIAIRR